MRLIYALCCPVTGEVHYVGKSTKGLLRPAEHFKESHSLKIKEWVEDLSLLGYKPVIKVLYRLVEGDDIDTMERTWIQKYINKGNKLLNVACITPVVIHPGLDSMLDDSVDTTIETISELLKSKRKSHNLDQVQYAERAGIALTVLRKIEQGKSNVSLNGMMDALRLIGYTITPVKIKKTYI